MTTRSSIFGKNARQRRAHPGKPDWARRQTRTPHQLSGEETQKIVAAFLRGAIEAVRGEEARAYCRNALTVLQQGINPEMPDPLHFQVSDFAICYQVWSLVRKYRDKLWVDAIAESTLVEKAVSGFLEVEKRCKYINKHGYIPGTAPSGGMPAPEQIIHLARRKIADVLGSFCYDELSRNIGFSSGSSTRLPRRRGAAPFKFQGRPHVTRGCALLAVNLIWFHEPWRHYCQDRFGRESDPFTWVKVVPGSEYFTVPKTATSLRGAAKEPELNMLCQKGIGAMIRKRLRRYASIDLNDQTLNQELAYAGSLTGELVTIDLASASDSVSLALLEFLPQDWADVIRMTRSEQVKLPDGTWHTLEKVSSMGNGFTFELESLIFWALTSATVSLCRCEDRRIGVYGDDLICHRDAAPSLIKALEYCGFEVNVDKTWIDGPFRESCGKHYYLGCDVTPFFVRGEVKDLSDAYHVLNSMNAWLYAYQSGEFRKEQLYWHRVLLGNRVNWSPPHMGSRAGLIPDTVGHGMGVYFCLRRQGYKTRVLTPRLKSRKGDGWHSYLAWMMNPGGEITIQDEKRVRMQRVSLYTSEWADACVRLPVSMITL